jgi:hypothetical protein
LILTSFSPNGTTGPFQSPYETGKLFRARSKVEWAYCVKELLDVHYPDAVKIRLVCDDLNTHTGGSLYQAFPPQEAKRRCDRLEFHPTPKHGSWLNIAETEFSALAEQCLDRRMDSKELVTDEVSAWEAERNRTEAKVRWRFTTEKARIKLEKLYPVFEWPEPPEAGRGKAASRPSNK